jgi:hypothetical protein
MYERWPGKQWSERAADATATRGSWALALFLLAATLLLPACASHPPANWAPERRFDFNRDTFAYPNELVWQYHYDERGKWVAERRHPAPTYALHCFVVARSARQFFQNARFDPAASPPDDATCRRLIRQVVSVNPRKTAAPERRIVIPGYRSLREFSQAREALLKAECGGAWESYAQRGHWRMVFPFSRRSQERLAAHLLEDLSRGLPPVLHLSRFPRLTINHAVVVFDAVARKDEVEFQIYDPNEPERPGRLLYHLASRTFLLPANRYFPGGRVDAYEVYSGWNY